MTDLENDVALVTGGTRGIGLATAEALAADGATVIASFYRDETAAESARESIAERGTGASETLQFDVSDHAAVKAAVDDVVDRYGRPTILINNAGVMRNRLLVRMDPEDWDRVIRTNLTGTFNCTREVARHMLRGDGGRIVNVASVAAHRGWPGQSNYAASKAGIVGFTRAIANELGGKSIRVNAVAPGYTDTDMYEANLPESATTTVERETASGNPAAPAEIAEAIRFLASERSSYVNGEVLRVDDGLLG